MDNALPLLPSQAWFFEELAAQLPLPGDWSQSFLVRLPMGTAPGDIAAAVQDLWDAHPALRATFQPGPDGVIQRITPAGTPAPVAVTELAAIPQELPVAATAAMRAARERLDVEAGPLCGWTVLRTPADEPDLLFICVHELLADGVSFAILLADLERLLAARRAGDEPVLARRASYEDCVRRLHAYANSPAVRGQLRYWQSLPWQELAPGPAPGPAVPLSADVVTDLPLTVLDALDRDVAPGLDLPTEDVVIAAVADAVTAELGGAVCAELVHNGRTVRSPASLGRQSSALFHPTVLRTVGLFATSRICLLPPRSERNLASYVRDLAERLHEAPNDGADYGLLRYLSEPDAMRRVDAVKGTPQLYVNYLVGDAYARRPGGFTESELPVPRPDGPSFPPPFVAVTIRVWHGQFTLHWEHDPARCTPAAAQRIADQVGEVLSTGLPRTAGDVR